MGSQDDHTLSAVQMYIPGGTVVDTILQTCHKKKACSVDSFLPLTLDLKKNVCLLDEVLYEEL